MRLRCRFKLKESCLPTDYRRVFISFLKKSFSDYDGNLFKRLYSGKALSKPYGFSVRLTNPHFKEDIINLCNDEVDLYFTTGDIMMGMQAYNSFLKQKGNCLHIPYNNSMVLSDVLLIREKNIYSNNVMIQFNSPLVVRDHNPDTEEDYYYSYGTEGFNEILKRVLREQAKSNNEITEEMIDEFNLKGISPKKTVVRFYEQQIECSIGTYEMHGHPALIEHLYKNGMGSRRSSGFGVFEIR